MVTMTMIMEGVVGRYGASLYDYDSMNPWWGCWGNRPFVFVPCDGLCILLIVRLDGSDYCKPFPRSLIVLGFQFSLLLKEYTSYFRLMTGGKNEKVFEINLYGV